MRAHELLARLDGVRKQSSGWVARCPAHEDKKASLSINEGEKGVLLKCHAGCSIAGRDPSGTGFHPKWPASELIGCTQTRETSQAKYHSISLRAELTAS